MISQESNPENKRQSRLRAGISIIAFLIVLGILAYVIGKPIIQFAGDPELFHSWMQAQGIWGPFLFVLMMIAQIVVAFIPAGPIELAAGYAFGLWGGTALCLLGSTIGGIIVFLFVKKFGYKAITAFVSIDKINSVRFINKNNKLNLLVFLIFLIPGAPKDVVTYFVPLTPMKLIPFVLISNLARIPTFLLSVAGGAAIGAKYYIFGALLVLVALLSGLFGIVWFKKTEKKEALSQENRES